jgi:hypothetical protein
VQRLLSERRDQFQGFIDTIDRCFVSKSPPSSSSDSGKERSVLKKQQQQQQQQQQPGAASSFDSVSTSAAVSDKVEVHYHGVKRSSAAAASQLNTMDQVSRMAADMTGSSISHNSLVSVPSPAPQLLHSPSSCAAAPFAGGSSAPLDVDDLEQKLRVIGLSDDAAVLADMCAKLRKGGIMSLQDLHRLSKEEVKESVQALMLSPAQHIKLFKAV